MSIYITCTHTHTHSGAGRPVTAAVINLAGQRGIDDTRVRERFTTCLPRLYLGHIRLEVHVAWASLPPISLYVVPGVCVCVCVLQRGREREREKKKERERECVGAWHAQKNVCRHGTCTFVWHGTCMFVWQELPYSILCKVECLCNVEILQSILCKVECLYGRRYCSPYCVR
jgi:hypothetical protein